MGNRPNGMSLDRIDNNREYSKENCRWATKEAQSRNMRSNKYITFNGDRKILKDWSIQFNIPICTLYNRIYKYKWTIERALNTPRKQN